MIQRGSTVNALLLLTYATYFRDHHSQQNLTSLSLPVNYQFCSNTPHSSRYMLRVMITVKFYHLKVQYHAEKPKIMNTVIKVHILSDLAQNT